MNRAGLSSNPLFVSFCLLLCLNYCTSRPAAEQALVTTPVGVDSTLTALEADGPKPGQIWRYDPQREDPDPFKVRQVRYHDMKILAVRDGYVLYANIYKDGSLDIPESHRIHYFLLDTYLLRPANK